MKLATYLTVLSVCAFSSTFAEEPQTPAAQSTVAATPVTATIATAVVKPAAAAPATDAAAAEAQVKLMRARGYKTSTRNGTVVYCRSEGQIGTHFEKTHCNTLEELKAAEHSGKEYVNQIQQQGSPTQFQGDKPGAATH